MQYDLRLSSESEFIVSFSGIDENEENEVEDESKDKVKNEDSLVEFTKAEVMASREAVLVTEDNELRRHAKNDGQMRILKTTLRMNLVTIVLLLFLLPRHILAIYNYQCYLREGGCSNYLLFFNRAAFLQICVTFILPLVVLGIIDKIS